MASKALGCCGERKPLLQDSTSTGSDDSGLIVPRRGFFGRILAVIQGDGDDDLIILDRPRGVLTGDKYISHRSRDPKTTTRGALKVPSTPLQQSWTTDDFTVDALEERLRRERELGE